MTPPTDEELIKMGRAAMVFYEQGKADGERHMLERAIAILVERRTLPATIRLIESLRPEPPVEKEEPARGGEEPAIVREMRRRFKESGPGFLVNIGFNGTDKADVLAYIDSLKADRPKAGRESEQPFAPSCPHCGVGGPMFLEADRAIVEAAERYEVAFFAEEDTRPDQPHSEWKALIEAVRAKRAAGV